MKKEWLLEVGIVLRTAVDLQQAAEVMPTCHQRKKPSNGKMSINNFKFDSEFQI
jgi:hypothetical protein